MDESLRWRKQSLNSEIWESMTAGCLGSHEAREAIVKTAVKTNNMTLSTYAIRMFSGAVAAVLTALWLSMGPSEFVSQRICTEVSIRYGT